MAVHARIAVAFYFTEGRRKRYNYNVEKVRGREARVSKYSHH